MKKILKVEKRNCEFYLKVPEKMPCFGQKLHIFKIWKKVLILEDVHRQSFLCIIENLNSENKFDFDNDSCTESECFTGSTMAV